METILLVENEYALRELMRRFLEVSGYAVMNARDGVESLSVATAHPTPIDLLLTDVVMPTMSGIELAQRIVGLHQETRVLFMSGYARPVLPAGGARATYVELAVDPAWVAVNTSTNRVYVSGANLSDGERVLRQGMTGTAVYVVLDGEVCIRIDGQERARLGRGEVFGEVSALLGEPPTADVVAVGMVRALVIPGPELRPFLLEHPQVTFRMLQAESRRLRTANLWTG